MVIIWLFIIIILLFVYNRHVPKRVIYEKFNDNVLLQKCFDATTLNSFKKYSKFTTILKVPHGVVYTTPNKYIEGLPQVSWNGVFLNNLCIDPKMRHMGVGTKLVRQVIDKAKKDSNDHIILQVKKDNIHAIQIYIRLGFVKHLEA